MKRILFVILATIVVGNISAQYIMVDTVKLNNAYRALMADFDNSNKQREFFDAFPKTWMEYIVTYQYIPDKKKANLYDIAHKHVDAFSDLTQIPDSLYYGKLVNIAVGAMADADAPSYLRSCLRYRMKNNSEKIFDVLSHFRKGHRFEFWEFYWSNIVVSADIPKELDYLAELHKECHPEEVQIMKDAFKYFYNGVNFVEWGYRKGD